MKVKVDFTVGNKELMEKKKLDREVNSLLYITNYYYN